MILLVAVRDKRLIFLLIILLLSAATAWAQVIKLASPFPAGSQWDIALHKLADEWREITAGQVKIRVYSGGTAGEEDDIIRKIKIGQIDAGILSSFGLKTIVSESIVLALPGFVRSEYEMDYLLENFVGRFDERFREAGFEILTWTKSGWVYIFGESPLRIPDDLRKQYLAVGSTENEIIAAFKVLGFNVVPMKINETMIALHSGMANSFYGPPIIAAAFQWFAAAPFMTNYPLAPVFGALVIGQQTWNRIPKKYHSALKEALDMMVRSFDNETRRLNSEALAIMKRHGLKIVNLSEDEITQWNEVMLASHATMLGDGKAVPEALYLELSSIIKSIR